MRHIVSFSGGIGSWAAAKRVAEKHGTQALTLLFTDTLMEDGDLYRFLIEGACNVFGIARPGRLLEFVASMPEFHEAPERRKEMLSVVRKAIKRVIPNLVWLAEGRDPWTVFFDKRFLGNSRVDPCSKTLKRELVDKWAKRNTRPDDAVFYVGIDWSEQHRFDDGKGGGIRPRKLKDGWVYEAPMCEPPLMMKADMLKMLKTEGIRLPRLYEAGFSHNNCGGFCCKAGQGHFSNLLRVFPDRFRFHEQKEQDIMTHLGREATMMTEVVNKQKKRLPLREFRQRIEAGAEVDRFDIGGCGCFLS